MSENGRIALYARVSTESQTRDHTIASQLAALRDRLAADGHQIEPEDIYVDEGYSGAILLRPALERLRDAAAAGQLACVYVQWFASTVRGMLTNSAYVGRAVFGRS